MELFGAKLQYEAGMKYYKGSGQGYTRNRRKAFKLFQEAAEAGLVDAMIKLSEMYGKGEGCIRNPEESFKWLERAANKGNAEAQYQVGKYLNEYKNKPYFACEYFEKAASQGHVNAMYVLGEIYNRFDYYDRAIHWLSQPALNNNPHAIYNLAKAYERKEAAELNPFGKIDELFECIDEEFDIYIEKEQIDNTHDSSQTQSYDELEDYQPSKKVKSLYKKALHLYEQEASFGDWECVLEVANMYLHGIGTEIDYQVAFQYYYHLANQPKSDSKVRKNNEFYRESAMIKLAKMYELGLGCEQNISKCEELINQLNIDKEWFKNMVL